MNLTAQDSDFKLNALNFSRRDITFVGVYNLTDTAGNQLTDTAGNHLVANGENTVSAIILIALASDFQLNAE